MTAGWPLIGFTASTRKGRVMGWFNRLALLRAGARSVRITAARPYPIERLDGLVIGGGDDIDAALYGLTREEPTVRIDPERDALELRALDWAEQAGVPVLGICRGAQMINVHRGGSLHVDIHAAYEEAPRMRTVLPRKTVSIDSNSRLAAILRLSGCRVNALHRQSVDRLGRGVRAVAHDEAGIIQAIEAPDSAFLMGVQWHPEFLIGDRHQQRLYDALARTARIHAHEAAAIPPAERS